jgi:hypothetical protein
MRPRKTRFHDASSPVAHSRIIVSTSKQKNSDDGIVFTGSIVRQNKEEILENLVCLRAK